MMREDRYGNAAEQAAAEWIARRNGGLSADEQAELERWRTSSPAHAAAFADIESTWEYLHGMRRTAAAEQVGIELSRRTRGRQRRACWWTATGFAAAAAIAIAVLPVRRSAVQNPTEPAISIVVRPDSRTLPDGSTIELNADTEYTVDFSDARRGIRLVRGEALFAVRSDVTRPFVVQAGAVEVRAVGTAFAVRNNPQQVDVVVTEGEVAVERLPDPAAAAFRPAEAAPVHVGRGHRARITLGTAAEPPAIDELSDAELSAALAWRARRIEFNDTPFVEAVKVFNQHNRVQLVLGDDRLARRLITGAHWIDDPEGFARLAETGFGAKVQRNGNLIRLSSD